MQLLKSKLFPNSRMEHAYLTITTSTSHEKLSLTCMLFNRFPWRLQAFTDFPKTLTFSQVFQVFQVLWQPWSSLSVCLSVYLSVCVCVSDWLNDWLSASLFVHQSVCLPVCLSVLMLSPCGAWDDPRSVIACQLFRRGDWVGCTQSTLSTQQLISRTAAWSCWAWFSLKGAGWTVQKTF